ncbi:hypothetical protein DPEC_G00342040, partial [Dallia pectoralis]
MDSLCRGPSESGDSVLMGSNTRYQNGPMGPDQAEEDYDQESFPILCRSMSTSRRHSLGMPLSPIFLGRSKSPGSVQPQQSR